MTKKRRQLFGRRKVHSRRKFLVRVWGKGLRLTLVWGPRRVNMALNVSWRVCGYIRCLSVRACVWSFMQCYTMY